MKKTIDVSHVGGVILLLTFFKLTDVVFPIRVFDV